jgi:anti-anti-sigma factor
MMFDSGGPGQTLDVDLALISSSVGDGFVLVVGLRGELDVATRVELNALMLMTEWSGLPLLVNLTRLTFADSAGLAPLVESTRRRRESGRPMLRIGALGRVAGRIFTLLGVNAEPDIDVEAWDAAARRGVQSRADVCRSRPPRAPMVTADPAEGRVLPDITSGALPSPEGVVATRRGDPRA